MFSQQRDFQTKKGFSAANPPDVWGFFFFPLVVYTIPHAEWLCKFCESSITPRFCRTRYQALQRLTSEAVRLSVSANLYSHSLIPHRPCRIRYQIPVIFHLTAMTKSELELSVSESGNEELCSELSPDVDCRLAMKRVSNGDSGQHAKLKPEHLTHGGFSVGRGFSVLR